MSREEINRIVGNVVISGLVLSWVAVQALLMVNGYANLAGLISFGLIVLLILCGAIVKLWERWRSNG
jgi:hypothetical protein